MLEQADIIYDFLVEVLEYIETVSSKQKYCDAYKRLLNFWINKYLNSKDNCEQEELLFDIIIEILFSCKYQLEIPPKIYNKILTLICDNKYYDLLLKYYKKYDYLNKNKTMVKILVGYIKPSFLFKSEILTPIHLGRAVEKERSKDGVNTDEDLKWLHENCIGDDDFEGNISDINRRIGLFTGTYWAWKNYQKLGDPEYFGSFGYRRLLFPNSLTDLENYDYILPQKKYFQETLQSQIIRYNGEQLYNTIIESVKNVLPSEVDSVHEYFNQKSAYLLELYIMKKELFINYCEWIFKFLKYIINKYPNKIVIDQLSKFNQINFDRRDYAFIIERLTGYYFFKLTANKNLKYKEVSVFEPSFTELQKKQNQMILDYLRYNIKNKD